MDLVEVAMDRDAIYAKLGVPPEEPESGLDRWARMKAEREEPPPRERKLDIVPPTLAEVDQRIGERIAAEHKFMIDILGELLAHLQNDAEMRGPPGPSGPRGEQGPPGKLPLLKLWEPDVVHYQGDVVTHDGGTWQATRDTGKAPGTKDWVALAVAGRDGRTPRVRGTYSADATYQALDLVMRESSSFIATRDDPGPCPGDGWQIIACGGKRGAAGEKGDRGERGPQGNPGLTGATIREWKIDRARYVATPVMTDGRDGPPLELRGLFEQFWLEAR
jgi:hypothetical protein